MPKVLITGATGAVGPLVVKALHDEGYAIRTLSLAPPPAEIWPDDVVSHIGDVTDAGALDSVVRGVDAVVHMAALLHLVNPPPEMRAEYERINVGGTAAVMNAAVKASVRHAIFFSTIAVYGASEGRILNELSPANPDTFYARTKYDAERIVLNAKDAAGRPLGSVLRLGAVYGSRIKGNYERLTHALAHRRFIPIGRGSNRRTLIYDKDVGRAVVRALLQPAAAGRVYNLTDGGFHTLDEIIEAICRGLGRRPPRFSLPVGPVRTLAGFIEKGAKAIGRQSPVTQETVDKYTEDIAVDGSLIQKEIGFSPRYDLKTGWEETIREMRHEKII